MSDTVRIKFCGLTEAAAVEAAIAVRAAYVGFVFFAPSPRNLSIDAAIELALLVPPGVAKVALTVDAEDTFLRDIVSRVPLDMLQLHGNESPQRVAEVRRQFGLPVMKAVGISDEDDLQLLDRYANVADQLLVDARPPRGAKVPGGRGVAFDWELIAGRRWTTPWMLAGGLTPANVAEAVRLTGARQVDVSSGVENAPGAKDPALIRSFAEAVRNLSDQQAR